MFGRAQSICRVRRRPPLWAPKHPSNPVQALAPSCEDARRNPMPAHFPNESESRQARYGRAVIGFALVGPVVYIACLVYVMLARRTYPFDLEWMEGGMLTHAARLIEGRPIYAKPSLDFIAYFYTPLYSVLVAALARATALSYALGRSVSIVATLGTLLLLFDFGRRQAGTLYGILAASLYAALFRTTGAFYDLVRPDPLALFLTLAGAWVAYYKCSSLSAAAAALLFVAAYFTKQTAAIAGISVGLWLFARCRRRGSVFLGTAFGVGVTIAVILDQRTDGWFRFYVLLGHQTHSFLWKHAVLEYWRDLLCLMPLLCLVPLLRESYGQHRRWIACALVLLFSLALAQRISTLDYDYHQYYRELWYEKPRWALLLPPVLVALLLGFVRVRTTPTGHVPGFFLVFFGAGVLASLLNHSTQWAYSNCFMPFVLGASLYVPLAIAGFVESSNAALRGHAGAILLALLVQCVALGYDPKAQIPDQYDREAFANLDGVLSGLRGQVLMPAHPFFMYERGGPLALHQVGIGDVYWAGGVPDLESRMRRHEFAYVIIDSRARLPVVERYYRPYRGIAYPTEGALLPRTGFLTRPLMIYQAK